MKPLLALALLLLQSPQPAFRASINFVELDVSVIDRHRRPVTGLRAADFTVLEDGVPQKVETFQAVMLPEPVPPPAAWSALVPADVERNTELGDSSLLVLVIDDGGIHASQTVRVKSIAARLIDRMSPADRMAVVYTERNGQSQDFTSDKALLRAALNRFGAGGGGMLDAASDIGGAFEQEPPKRLVCPGLVDTLTSVARLTASYQSRRKTAFVIAEGVPALVSGDACFYPLLDLFREAQRANLNIYPINPRGLQGFGDVTITSPEAMKLSIDFMRLQTSAERTLAENTGGIAITQTNLFDENIERAYVENRSYYLLGYHSTNPSTDRKLRKISVSVARDGVTVRARSGYSAGSAASNAAAARTDVPAALDAASRALIPATALHLEATVVPLRTAQGTLLAVVAAARPEIRADAGSVAEELQARVTLVDGHGAIKGTAERRVGGRLTAAEGRRAELRLPLTIAAPAGRYQVRVAANSAATGATGSVFVNVDVPDFSRERLSLSGVAMRVQPDPPAMRLPALEQSLPFVPSTRRHFRSGDRVDAAVMVYSNGLPQSITISCRILDAQGVSVTTHAQNVSSEQAARAEGASRECPVPVQQLGAGHFLLEFTAQAGQHSVTRKVKFYIE